LALIKTAQDYGTSLRIVETVVSVNDQRKRAMARKVTSALGGSIRGKTIAVLGLTFKPNTDDMRESPSIALIEGLQRAGARIRAYDPQGIEQAMQVLSDVDCRSDPYECAAGADALVLVTEWDVFRALDLKRLAAVMAGPVFVDLRNVYRRFEAEEAGFLYTDIGRGR
jgi:UDPglucose 6-dehydrogenase